jgi:hypothetical protein
VKRAAQASHWRRRRMAAPSSVGRLSFTWLSSWPQKGHRMGMNSPFALSEVEGPHRAKRDAFASAQAKASTSPPVKFILSACCKQAVEGLSPNGV